MLRKIFCFFKQNIRQMSIKNEINYSQYIQLNSGTCKIHFFRCQESGEWSQVFGCNQIPKKGQCCKVLTFSLQDKTFHFLNLYAPFLGPWIQVRKQGNETFQQKISVYLFFLFAPLFHSNLVWIFNWCYFYQFLDRAYHEWKAYFWETGKHKPKITFCK